MGWGGEAKKNEQGKGKRRHGRFRPPSNGGLTDDADQEKETQSLANEMGIEEVRRKRATGERRASWSRFRPVGARDLEEK